MLPLFSITLLCILPLITPLSITANPSSVPQSTPINITWTGADPSSTHDWVTFWQIGAAPPPQSKSIVSFSWQYIYGGQAKFPTESDAYSTESGTIAVTAPSQPGIYRVYYCLNGDYQCPAYTIVTVTKTKKNNIKCSEKTLSNIKHIVLVVSENHSFDSIYGGYCQAPANSNPECNNGPLCCEAAPETLEGVKPVTLTDAQNVLYDPDHSHPGEVCKQNNRRMDQFLSGCGSTSNSYTWAVADEKSAYAYFEFARQYALADRFFQSAAGASSENDMYYITGEFLFIDNDYLPQNSDLNGARCFAGQDRFISYYNPTILDLLDQCGIEWVNYAEGWSVQPNKNQCYPNFFDATDFAASYYPSLTVNREKNWKDLPDFYNDVDNGKLPSYSYIKGLGINSEHPGNTLSNGELISEKVVKSILNSKKYQNNTLIVLVPDESGGYFDHIIPPTISKIDGQNYGPRIPLVLVGNAVKRNYISHKEMEPTSILKFIEWNWFGGETGQLGTRDQVVANIGDMIDEEKAGVKVPIF